MEANAAQGVEIGATKRKALMPRRFREETEGSAGDIARPKKRVSCSLQVRSRSASGGCGRRDGVVSEEEEASREREPDQDDVTSGSTNSAGPAVRKRKKFGGAQRIGEQHNKEHPRKRQWYNQRIPGWAVGQEFPYWDGYRVPSLHFRNREEEESWLQWRRERTQRQEEEAGPSTRREKEAYPANTRVQKEDTSTQRPIVAIAAKEAPMGELNVQHDIPIDLDSDSEDSDSESEGGKMVAILKKYLKGKEKGGGIEKNSKETTPVMVLAGAGDTYACALTETAAHLPKKARKSIEEGKFVDIYSLTREAVQEKEEGVKQEEKGRRGKSIFDWLKGFLVFSSVYLVKKPEQSLNIIKYIDTIIDTYLFYKGTSWYDYDQAFRKKIVNSKMLSFGQKDIDLWTRLVSKESSTSHNVNKGSYTVKPRNVCFAYNERRCNRGYACKFRHACSACGSSHIVSECNRKRETQANRQPFRGAQQKSGNASADGQAK
ncbi:uncharacterized protein LOC121394660 isoform X1 [Xenopus laevis]|uniref:Uncharacterized protein LOC121394660 isoform X1 n=2 Tax=Xenopus laevis TaxID=8355 RepID=A0A8J1L0S4_XENLA|nr:uncharacterized protein LOC121394660 isoform X1 [Xenopus laevis]